MGLGLGFGTLYPNSAKVAEEEGFRDIARTFRMVAKVEAYHERDIESCWKMLSKIKCLRRISPSCGSAGIAATFLREKKCQKNAQYVHIQEATSNYGQKTTKHNPFSLLAHVYNIQK